jgi:hypothetical protein
MTAVLSNGRLRTSHFTVRSLRVGPQGPAREVLLNRQPHFVAVAVLADRHARPDLPADSESRAWRDRDREASLTVDVSGDVRRKIHLALCSRARVLHRPWICHTPTVRPGYGSNRCLAPKGSVVTGSYLRGGRGLPTALPADHLLAGEGFAVMSGCAHGVASVQGNVTYPTRNFATLGIVVTPSPLSSDVARSFLPDSPCRHGDRTVSSLPQGRCSERAWRAVSEDPARTRFPADCPHRSDCHCSPKATQYRRILGCSSI